LFFHSYVVIYGSGRVTPNVLRLGAVFYLGLSEHCLSAKNIATNKQIITESMLQYFVAGS